MSITTRIKIALSLAGFGFWLPIAVTFFQSKGFSLSAVYFLVTFFSVSMVILEYPTGVIGDFFSHKLSVQAGFYIASASLFLSTFIFQNWVYYLLLFLYALAAALASGSDLALLHTYSGNFKKDTSDLKTMLMLALLVASVTGSYVAKFNINYPHLLSALFHLMAGLLLTGIPNKKREKPVDANIFSTAKDGLLFAIKRKNITGLLLLSAGIGTLILTMKWFYNPIFESLSIPIQYWGTLVSISIGFTALGSFLARKVGRNSLKVIIPILLAAYIAIGITKNITFVITAILVYSLVHGIYEVNYLDIFNKEVDDDYRSGSLSLGNLLTRVLYATLTLLAGILLGYMSVFTFMIFAGITISLVTLISLLIRDKKLSS